MNLRSVLLIILLSGCAATQSAVRETKANALSAKNFQPLALGTKWEYELTLLGAKQRVSVELIKKDGQYVVDSTGAHFAVDQFGLRDEKRYLLRNPVQVGATWTNVVSVSSIERYEIVSAGQPCSEAGLTFDHCVVVVSKNTIRDDQVLEAELTFAENTGIVRASTVLLSKGQRVEQSSLVLSRFTPVDASVAPTGVAQ